VDQHRFAKYFDHTLLKPDATAAMIEKTCAEAAEHQFFSVCINSHWLPLAKARLAGSKVKPICVIGFPLGACATAAKVYETKWCVDSGAEEIDMVLNVGAFKSGEERTAAVDIEAVVKAAAGKAVKVILETGLLTRNEIVVASRLSAEAGAAFVKTSTGFGPRGASVEDIAAMREGIAAAGRLEVAIKASGGIRDLPTTMAMIEAGATRIGASASVAILQDFRSGGKATAASAGAAAKSGY
jgi:deoxyribose-phosphate aldolase